MKCLSPCREEDCSVENKTRKLTTVSLGRGKKGTEVPSLLKSSQKQEATERHINSSTHCVHDVAVQFHPEAERENEGVEDG